jgi:hypothetical protein
VTSRFQGLFRDLHSPVVRGVRLHLSVVPHETEAERLFTLSVVRKLISGFIPGHHGRHGVDKPWLCIEDRFEEQPETIDGGTVGTKDGRDDLLTQAAVGGSPICTSAKCPAPNMRER